MNRCGGCRAALDAVVGGDAVVWACSNVDCDYEGPTMAERIDRAVRELVSEGALARVLSGSAPEFIEGLCLDGLRDATCERCGGFYMTALPGRVCCRCLDGVERHERGILTLHEMAAKMTGQGRHDEKG